MAAGVGLLVAVADLGAWRDGSCGPMAWANWAIPPLERMHHPVRATLIALPVLAVGLALGLDGFSKGAWVGVALVVAVVAKPESLHRVATYDSAPDIPFSDKVPEGGGPVIDLLGMDHRAALSLQTVHRGPGGAAFVSKIPRACSAGSRISRKRRWKRVCGPTSRLGFETLLFFNRFGHHRAARIQVEALGPPESEGLLPKEAVEAVGADRFRTYPQQRCQSPS